MVFLLLCGCSDKATSIVVHSNMKKMGASINDNDPIEALLLLHIGPERKTIPPVILFSVKERYKSAISDIPEYLREFLRKEPIEPKLNSELYGCLLGEPPSSNIGFGTTLVAFYWPKHKAEYTLDINQMREFKAKWQNISTLPSSAADFFARIGLTNEDTTLD